MNTRANTLGEFNGSVEDGYMKLKEQHGGFASIVWIGCGIWHFWRVPHASFLSW